MDPIMNNYWYYTYFPTLLSSLQPISTVQQSQNVTSFYYQPISSIYTTGFNVQEYAQEVTRYQNALNEFQTAAENLGTVFSSRTLAISGEGLTGTVEENTPIGSYEINVTQLAQSQVNTGAWLNATENNFQTGTNTISINLNNTNYTFTVNVTEEMNNMNVLTNLAQQINEAGIGITAEVQVQGSQARLVLTGETGEENAFTVEDITGNIVEAAGLQNITQNAQNLIYEVNGVRHENATNEITAIQGVNLTATQTGEYTVEVNYNTQEIREAAQNFVESFNNLYEQAQNLAQYSPAIEASLNVIRNNPIMQGIGIVPTENGLQITEQFEQALENPETIQNLVMPAFASTAASAQNMANAMRNIPTYALFQNTNYNPFSNYYTYSYNPYMTERLLALNMMMTYFSVNNPYTYA